MKARTELKRRVQQTIERYRMLLPGEKVVVAVSGGIDSTVLLHLLRGLSQSEGYLLHVAHLNHMLLGEESLRDADFVSDLARNFGLKATIRSIGAAESLQGRSGSLQEWARRARYAFLEEVAGEVGAFRVALGHTRDDQAETVLLNLLRGAGMPGLRGIPPTRAGRFVRPLIHVSRKEIEEYALLHRIPFVTDSSNLKGTYLRNRIRLRLLPLLHSEYNPQVTETLAAAASILAAEEELLESMTSSGIFAVLQERKEGRVVLSIPALLQEPVALQRRILIHAARMASRSSYLPLSHRHIFALQEMLLGRSGSKLMLPNQMVAVKDYDHLIFASGEKPICQPWEYRLALDKTLHIPEVGIWVKAQIRRRQEVDLKDSAPLRAFLGWDGIVAPLILRNRRRGDRFHPLGAGGERKLKNFFIDAKVSRNQRDEIPLLVCQGEILWVMGFRIHERYRVREEAENILAVEVIPNGDEQGPD